MLQAMKKRRLKLNGKKAKPSGSPVVGLVVERAAKEAETKAAAGPATVAVTHLEFPPPDYLLEQARGEVNRKLIRDYRETITVLRDEKGFSFREIAAWLTENGVEADYSTVYLVYTKGMSEQQVAEVDYDEAGQDQA